MGENTAGTDAERRNIVGFRLQAGAHLIRLVITKLVAILKTRILMALDPRQRHSYYGELIGTRMRSIKWCHTLEARRTVCVGRSLLVTC